MTDALCAICSGPTNAKARMIEPHGLFCGSCAYCFFCWKKTRGPSKTSKWLKRAI